MTQPLLEVSNLKTVFPTDGGVVNAVNDVSFSIARGKTVGIVGESGCGKSITGLSLLQLVPNPGRIEKGEILFYRQSPKHPYTEALISAVPLPYPKWQRERELIRLEGDVPDPSQPPTGCHFHPRCCYATDVCKQETPELREITPDVKVACHLSETLELQGVS